MTSRWAGNAIEFFQAADDLHPGGDTSCFWILVSHYKLAFEANLFAR